MAGGDARYARGKAAEAACVVLAAIWLSGCGGGGGAEPAALTLPKMPNLTSAIPEPPPPAEVSAPQSATELYTRIARGSIGCWFGANGGMKKDYIYHADADAPSRGGKALITIHVRDPSQPNPRGAKAYKVMITPTGETSATIATENLKMPDEQAKAMTADVNRWAQGEEGCSAATTAALSPHEEPAKPAPEPKPAKSKTAKADKPH